MKYQQFDMDFFTGITALPLEHAFTFLPLLAATVLVFGSLANLFLFHLIIPSAPLKKYKRLDTKATYALITGGNGGIGYGVALSLVKHGFGVILLGRNAIKLDQAAKSLREALVIPAGAALADRDAFVRTMVLDPRTASGEEIRDTIRQEITHHGLNVSILVNNVGSAPIANPPFRNLSTYSSTDINSTIDLNARFMAHLTAQMLPVLAQAHLQGTSGSELESKGRSLILNLSSGAKIGLPYQVMYASTKAFNYAFSVGLSRELKADPEMDHIDVLAVVAGDVKSQGNIAGLTKGSPDSESYGEYIVEKTDGAIRRGWKEMCPYWLHHLNFIALSVTPETLVDKGILDIMSKKKVVMNEVMTSKE